MSNQPVISIFELPYWRRPEPKEKGAAEPTLIYQAVGEALSQWELVDQKLADLFLVFSCEPNTTNFTQHALRRAYGSVIGTANRRQMIRMAGEAYFPPWMDNNEDEQNGLRDVMKAGSWAAELRDDIAHGVGIENIEREIYENGSETKVVGVEKLGTFLMPPEYNTGRTFAHTQKADHVSDLWKARYCYNVDDINDIKWRFHQYGVAIARYIELVVPYVEKVRDIARDLDKLKRAIKKATTYPGSAL